MRLFWSTVVNINRLGKYRKACDIGDLIRYELNWLSTSCCPGRGWWYSIHSRSGIPNGFSWGNEEAWARQRRVQTVDLLVRPDLGFVRTPEFGCGVLNWKSSRYEMLWVIAPVEINESGWNIYWLFFIVCTVYVRQNRFCDLWYQKYWADCDATNSGTLNIFRNTFPGRRDHRDDRDRHGFI